MRASSVVEDHVVEIHNAVGGQCTLPSANGCRDRNEPSFLYDGIEPVPSIVPLLAEVDEDPTGSFCG